MSTPAIPTPPGYSASDIVPTPTAPAPTSGTIPPPPGYTAADIVPTGMTAPLQPYDPKIHGEYTTPENYTAWSNQATDANDPKFDDKKEWKLGERLAVEEARGSAAEDLKSAVSLNNKAVATGVGVGAAPAVTGAISEALPAVLPHTIAGVKAIGAWADAHPAQAIMLMTVLKELVPGAKKALGLVRSIPEIP